MSTIPETDQWKLDADCNKCRRQEYCKKACGQSTRIAREHLQEIWEKAMAEALQKKAEE